MITCSKTLQIPVKITAWIHMTWNILTFQKEKRPISWKQNLFLRNVFLRIVNPLHEKCTWPFKKLHGKQTNAICVKKICKQQKQYQNTNERMHWVLNLKVHQTCTGTKKTQVLNLKVHQTCTGTKRQNKQNFRGIVASSQVDCNVFFFVFIVPVHVWCTLKLKTFVFSVPV